MGLRTRIYNTPPLQYSISPVFSVRALDAEGLAEFGDTYNLGKRCQSGPASYADARCARSLSRRSSQGQDCF